MSAGTLTLTNGGAAVTGAGTNFTAELTASDFIVVTVGGTTHSLAIESVTNATTLVLSAPFTGPTTAAVAWQAVPRKTMLRVTAELNKQVTEALRVAYENAINWQAVLSSPDTVNVILPDGTTLTGFSWRKINDLLNALDVDHLDATATQIHTDAQHVAADKTTATQAAATATQAKTDSQTAQAAAEAAASGAGSSNASAAQHASDAAGSATAAAGSATAAANSAASVHPENMLRKDQNLDDLADKSAARSHLDVYSKSESDTKDSTLSARVEAINTDMLAKNTATNARISYSLLTITNPALNSRTVVVNPFGKNTPVMCVAEIFHATLQQWVSFPWTLGGSGATAGNTCSYSEGEGIVLRVAGNAYLWPAWATGTSGNVTSDYTTPSPVRIHIWKVAA